MFRCVCNEQCKKKLRLFRDKINKEMSYVLISRHEHAEGGRTPYTHKGLSGEFHHTVISESNKGHGGDTILKTLKAQCKGDESKLRRVNTVTASTINTYLGARRRFDINGEEIPRITSLLDVLKWGEDRLITTPEGLAAVKDEYKVIVLKVNNPSFQWCFVSPQ